MPNAADCATLQAYGQGVEHLMAEAAKEWGAERLPLLVSDTTRAKFLRTRASWSRVYQEAWDAPFVTRDQLAAVEDRAGGMRKAYAALIAEATENGHRPITPWVWEAMLSDGTVLAVCQTDDDAAKVIADGRYLRVVTAREVAAIWEALPTAMQIAKVEWPGAKFIGSGLAGGDKSWVRDGDPIPFGDPAQTNKAA